ncbi:MAG: MauE/DoxX family redox-associated membrane protein [Phycisphaerales bacterium]
MRYSGLISGLFRVGLACVFGYAGYQKLRAPEATDEFLAAFLRIELPGLGFAIGAAEAILALTLLLSIAPRHAARAAVIASAAFFTVHAYSMTLPEPPPPCGCMGAAAAESSDDDATIPWLWITGAMLFASAFLLWRAPARSRSSAGDPDPIPEGATA